MAKFDFKAMQDEIAKKTEEAFDLVIKDRRAHFERHPDERPNESSIKSIISACSTQNALIAGGSSMIPGPLGMVAVIPEIILILKNQMTLCYDIGVAYGKEAKITKEVLIHVFLSSFGMAGIGLAVMHGSRLLIKRASLSVLQKIIKILGGKILQKALKSMVSKWLPVVGAAAMATWAKFETDRIGKLASENLAKEFVTAEEELSEGDVPDSEPETEV